MRIKLIALFLALALGTAACGGGESTAAGEQTGPQKLIDAAQKEGTLTWYGGSTEKGLTAAAEKFEATYGIKVNVVRLISAQIAQRFASEVGSGKIEADVMTTVDPRFFADQHKAGNLIDMTAAEIPSVADLPAKFVENDASAAVFGISPYTVPWNTQTMKDFTISSWKDLLDPKVKGEILIVDPRKSAAWAQVWSGVLNDPQLGPDFIASFAKQGYRQVVDGGLLGAQLVAAGEGGVLFASTSSTTSPLVDQGAPVQQWQMTSPAPVAYQFIGVAKNAAHPNAARLFANWMLTDEGQKTYSIAEDNISPLEHIEGTRQPLDEMIPPNAEQADKDLPQILTLLGIK